MSNAINIINSHIAIREAQLKSLESVWELQEANLAHDKLTNSSRGWSNLDARMHLNEQHALREEITRLKVIAWEIEKSEK